MRGSYSNIFENEDDPYADENADQKCPSEADSLKSLLECGSGEDAEGNSQSTAATGRVRDIYETKNHKLISSNLIDLNEEYKEEESVISTSQREHL